MSTSRSIGPFLVQLSRLECGQRSQNFAVASVRHEQQIQVLDSEGNEHLFSGLESAEQIGETLAKDLPDLSPPSDEIFRTYFGAESVWSSWVALLYDLGIYEPELRVSSKNLEFKLIERLDDKALVSVTAMGYEETMVLRLGVEENDGVPHELAQRFSASHPGL